LSDLVKVFFLQDIGDDKYETESLWCIRDGDNYIIDNIPIVAKRISLGDTIKVEYDPNDKIFYFDDFVAVSGNTTVRMYFENTDLIEPVRTELNVLGCESEVLLQRKVVAVNIPREADYKLIRKFLDEGEEEKKWIYEESCLAHEY
jgi:hypothetical protein